MLNGTNQMLNNSSFGQFEKQFFGEEPLRDVLPLCTTAFMAFFVSKKQVRVILQHLFVSFSCILPLSLITVPILFSTIIFFGTIRFFVGIFVKVKHGKRFRGLLPGRDTIWTIQDISQAVISTIWVIESKKSFEEFVEYIRNDVCSSIVNHSNEKLTCTRHRELGYSFLMKSTSSLQHFQRNYIKTVKIEGDFNRNSLEKTVFGYFNSELPENNTALWEILVFDKPIDWNSNGKRHFAVGFRIHHCLADGLSLIKLLLEHFSDTKQVENKLKDMISPRKRNLREKFNEMCRFLGAVAFGPAVLLLETFLRPKDLNILHGRPLSGQKFAIFRAESQKEFVGMVKQIKTKFSASGIRFSDVVLAGIAASFRDYYKKRGSIPERISAVIPALFTNKFNISDEDNLSNSSFSVGTVNLATSKHGQGVLQEIRVKMDDLRNSSEYIVNYYLLPVISAVLPEPFLRKIVESVHCTLVISCLLGTKQLRIFRGDKLQDVVFWIPHRGFTGIGVSVLSYDGRFQIGLSADKALIPDEESAHEIINGVFYHIQNIYHSFVLL